MKLDRILPAISDAVSGHSGSVAVWVNHASGPVTNRVNIHAGPNGCKQNNISIGNSVPCDLIAPYQVIQGGDSSY